MPIFNLYLFLFLCYQLCHIISQDQVLHQLLISCLCNLAQYAKGIDNKSLTNRFFAIFNGLFPIVYNSNSIDSESSRCLVDILVVLSNLIINLPNENLILVCTIFSDSLRLIGFLKSFLNHVDFSTNSQISAHLNEKELEFTTLLVGILRFFEKLVKHFEEFRLIDESVNGMKIALDNFPVQTFRRDSRGDSLRFGTRTRLKVPIDPVTWSEFIGKQGWPIIYGSIPWNRFLD